MKLLKKQGLAKKLQKRDSIGSSSSMKSGQKRASIGKHPSALNIISPEDIGPLHETLSKQQMDYIERKAEQVRKRAARRAS